MTNEADPEARRKHRMAYLLKRAFLDLDDAQGKLLEPLRINGRELAVLLLLQAREPESQQQAAERLKVDRTTMVALLDGLETKGLVVRRADDDDRRRNVVALTTAGQQTVRKAVRVSDKAERRLLGDLDQVEQAQLRALLTRIVAPRDQ